MSCYIAPASRRGADPTEPQHKQRSHAIDILRSRRKSCKLPGARPAAEAHRVEGSQPEAPAETRGTPVKT